MSSISPLVVPNARASVSSAEAAPISPRVMATNPSAQRAMYVPRLQPLSTMAWRARRWASTGSAPAHDTIAWVERITCAQ